jgi:hypothetical protein
MQVLATFLFQNKNERTIKYARFEKACKNANTRIPFQNGRHDRFQSYPSVHPHGPTALEE